MLCNYVLSSLNNGVLNVYISYCLIGPYIKVCFIYGLVNYSYYIFVCFVDNIFTSNYSLDYKYKNVFSS